MTVQRTAIETARRGTAQHNQYTVGTFPENSRDAAGREAREAGRYSVGRHSKSRCPWRTVDMQTQPRTRVACRLSCTHSMQLALYMQHVLVYNMQYIWLYYASLVSSSLLDMQRDYRRFDIPLLMLKTIRISDERGWRLRRGDHGAGRDLVCSTATVWQLSRSSIADIHKLTWLKCNWNHIISSVRRRAPCLRTRFTNSPTHTNMDPMHAVQFR